MHTHLVGTFTYMLQISWYQIIDKIITLRGYYVYTQLYVHVPHWYLCITDWFTDCDMLMYQDTSTKLYMQHI